MRNELSAMQVASSSHERSDIRDEPKNPGYRSAHPGYARYASIQKALCHDDDPAMD
jgi:hypothetical protein